MAEANHSPMRTPRDLHPELTPAERRQRLLLGVERFNAGDFYAAHDAWEEVWRSTSPAPRPLLQGLIQAAAGLYQIRDLGRRNGPRGTLGKALRNLAPYALPDLSPETRLGLAVAELARELEEVCLWLDLGEGHLPLPRLQVAAPEALV